MHRGYTPGSCLGIILTGLTYLRRECALLLAVASPNRFWRSSTDDLHLQIRWRATVERAQAFSLSLCSSFEEISNFKIDTQFGKVINTKGIYLTFIKSLYFV